MAGNKESSWQKAAVLGPSPSAFTAAGVQGWGGECGSSCAMEHQNLEPPATLSPLVPALWTGRAGRRVVLVWTALGKAGEAIPAMAAGHLGCCRGPSGLAEERGGCNKSKLDERCRQREDRHVIITTANNPSPGAQHYKAATSLRPDSSLRLCPP